jgi:hypothetical protein
MTTRSDDWSPKTKPQCNSSVSAPVTDAVVSVVSLVGAGYVAYVEESCDDAESCGRLSVFVGIPALLVGLVTGLSALEGRRKVKQCREAERQHSDWLRRGDG